MSIETTLDPATEAKLYETLLEYQAILDNAPLGIAFTRNRVFLQCNDKFSNMFGWSCDELVGRPIRTILPSREVFEELVHTWTPLFCSGQLLDTELLMKRRDGSTFWCRMLVRAIDTADPDMGSIFMAEDFTERKAAQEALMRARDELECRVQERTAELAKANALLQEEIQERRLAEEQIRHLAHHDPLTGLLNRRLLEDRLEQAMGIAKRNGKQVAVQFIDLDHFKEVNDRLGHRVGDLLLQAVAMRLRGLLREVDTISRVGGDEFVVVLPDMQSATAAGETAQRVLRALEKPYSIEGHELTVTPSIGVSRYPKDGSNAQMLISRADAAMYQAKKSGRANYRMFSPDEDRPAILP